MKLFGKAFLIKEIVLVVIVFTAAMWYVGSVQQHNADLLAQNKIYVSSQQANVDTWLSKIDTEIKGVSTSLGLYNAYVAAHPNDFDKDIVGTKNSLASDIYQHQFACQNLIEDYNKARLTWPSFVHTQSHSITECGGE